MPDNRKTITDDERTLAARRALWSNHPLALAALEHHGGESVSLRQLIAFVRTMPQDQFNAAMFSAGVRR